MAVLGLAVLGLDSLAELENELENELFEPINVCYLKTLQVTNLFS